MLGPKVTFAPGVQVLHRPGHQVRHAVAQGLESLIAVLGDDLQVAPGGRRLVQRVMGSIDSHRQGVAEQALADLLDGVAVGPPLRSI